MEGHTMQMPPPAETHFVIVQIKQAWTREELGAILTTAVEGGSDYWADYTDIERDDELNIQSLVVLDEKDSEGEHAVGWRDMARGIELILNGTVHIRDDLKAQIVTERDACDADVADCILQAAIFGEIVYG